MRRNHRLLLVLAALLLSQCVMLQAQSPEEVYTGKLIQCYIEKMEINQEYDVYVSFVDSTENPAGDWAWVEPNPEYRRANLFVDRETLRFSDRRLRRTIVHELEHITWMDAEWALYQALKANLVLVRGMTPEMADAAAWDQATFVFHQIIVRVERYPLWQNLCHQEELYAPTAR
jgi:hypothetical protein